MTLGLHRPGPEKAQSEHLQKLDHHDAFGNKDACVPVRTPEMIFISAQAS
jgi:hypothetical protein